MKMRLDHQKPKRSCKEYGSNEYQHVFHCKNSITKDRRTLRAN